MKKGGDQTESVATGGGFTGFTKLEAGVGFALVPASRDARYPVHVYLNNSNTDPVVVDSPAFERDTAFTSLRVDVTPGGGRDGDQWKAFILPDTASRVEPRLLVNAEGFLAVRNAGARVLFDLDTRVDTTPFIPLAGVDGDGDYSIRPNAPGAFSKTLGDAWDLSGFTRVLYVVDQGSIYSDKPEWSFKPYVSPAAATSGRPLRQISMGSVAEFGRAPATPWDGEPGSLLFGTAGSGDEGPSWKTVPDFYPYAYFKFTIAGASFMNPALFGDEGYYLRVMALAY